VPDVSEQK